jgi:2'-5' RNA ligase
MTMLRLFLAIPVPGEVKKELVAAQKILTHANPHVRGVELPGIHLTMKFLGDTPEEKIGAIRKAMESAAAAVAAPIRLRCAGTDAFPNLDRPRVLWAGLSGDTEALGALHRELERALERLGFAREERAFHPHLTLGRLKEPKMLGALHKAWPRVAEMAFGEFAAEALVLYRSELKPAGAVYTSIERVALPG